MIANRKHADENFNLFLLQKCMRYRCKYVHFHPSKFTTIQQLNKIMICQSNYAFENYDLM